MPTMDSLTDELLETDPGFRSLFEEHKSYKRKLRTIRQKSLPSQEDEVEIKRIKVEKLRLKDQMEQIRQQHTAHAAAV